MNIQFQTAGHSIGPMQIGAFHKPAIGSCLSLYDPEQWKLEVYDSFAGWVNPRNNERILEIRFVMQDPEFPCLAFRFNYLGGTYRLTALSDEADPSFNTICFNQEANGRDPFYLSVPGLDLKGRHHIPMYYIDRSNPIGTLSRGIDLKEGIAQCGGLEIRLVDVDGHLTEAFSPRGANTLFAELSETLSAEETDIQVDSNDGFPESGFLYIESEAIHYGQKIGNNRFGDCQRGRLGTSASSHLSIHRVYPVNPFWKGRMVRVLRPEGASFSDQDPILYCGVIESLSPSSDNLASYTLELIDPTVLLDTKIGRRMGRGNLLDRLIVQAEESNTGRLGNDSLYFRTCRHPVEGWRYYKATIPHGPYLSDADSIEHPENIASALRKAIEEELEGATGPFSIDANGHLHLNFRVEFAFQLLAAEDVGSDRDSILESLGLEEQTGVRLENPSGLFSRMGENAEYMEIRCSRPIQIGCGRNNTTVYLADPGLGQGGVRSFARGNLARIEDEIIYYDHVDFAPDLVAPSTALSESVGVEDVSLASMGPEGFSEYGGVFRIDEELIVYGRIMEGVVFANCVRGTWGTQAVSHAAGTPITGVLLPSLQGCIRGVYGTMPGAHEGGTKIQEIWSSDRIVRNESGGLEIEPASPEAFLLDLLDYHRESSRYGIKLPEDILNEASIHDTLIENSLNHDGSFRRLIYADETYRSVLEDFCRSLNVHFFTDETGRFSLRRFEPKLRHQEPSAVISHANLLDPPSMEWREDLCINRVEVQLDYDTVRETYRTTLVVDDDSLETRFGGEREDRTLSVESQCVHTGRLPLLSGNGEGWYFDLAWSIIRRYNRFLTRIDANVLPSSVRDIGLFHSVTVASNALPDGGGSRGMSDVTYDVVELEADPSANRIRLGLLERDEGRYAGISPSARVVGWSGQNNQAVITRDHYWPERLSPSKVYTPGDRLRVIHKNALDSGLFEMSEILVLAAEGVDDSTWADSGEALLRFESPPTVSPSYGDILISVSYGGQYGELSKLDRFAFLADEEETLGAAEDPALVYSY